MALAKRVERGDLAAKEKMSNAHLRLVVSIAKRCRGLGAPFLDLIQEDAPVSGLEASMVSSISRPPAPIGTLAGLLAEPTA